MPSPEGRSAAQMGTIGADATLDMAAKVADARPDVQFLDAPVSGSKDPAEKGQLLILASGSRSAEPMVAPPFDAIGRKPSGWGRGQGAA